MWGKNKQHFYFSLVSPHGVQCMPRRGIASVSRVIYVAHMLQQGFLELQKAPPKSMNYIDTGELSQTDVIPLLIKDCLHLSAA